MDLKQTLQKFPLLQGISLGFQFCREITDAGLDHLGQSFQALNSLKYLSLNFTPPLFGIKLRITDDGLKNLCQGLEKHTALQHLALRLQKSQNKTHI